jgi:hypothetical protein
VNITPHNPQINPNQSKSHPSQSQGLEGSALENLSTVSALLSGVTATALQTTYSMNGRLATRMNILWFISLGFSVASAIQCQLAFYWTRHPYRTPSLKMSMLGSFLITRAPLAFFINAAVAFAGGFLAFVFIILSSTAIHALAVMCAILLIGYVVIVLFWIVGEMLAVEDISRWIPSRAAVRRPPPAPAPSHTSVPTQRDPESRSPGRADAVRPGMPEMVAFGSVQDGFVNEQPPFVPVSEAGAAGSALLLSSLGASHSNGSPSPCGRIRPSGIKQALQHPELRRCAFKLQPFASAIRRIAFSADGHFLASCAWEPGVEVWKVDLHKSMDPPLLYHCPETSVVNDVVWCPDPNQTRFLALCDEVVKLWQVEV